MNRCAECGFDWDATSVDVIADIASWSTAYRAGLTRFLEGEDGDVLVRTRPAPQVWSALEYTVHMRDVVHFYLDRIQRVLSEDRPVMAAADFSTLAQTGRYNDEEIERTLTALDTAAKSAARLLSSLEPAHWARAGVGSEGDERTVLVLARRLAHDGHHHLLDLGRVLRAVRGVARPRAD